MTRVSRLKDMAYDEVSLVDKGANLDVLDGETGAHVLLFKRDTSDETLEDIEKVSGKHWVDWVYEDELPEYRRRMAAAKKSGMTGVKQDENAGYNDESRARMAANDATRQANKSGTPADHRAAAKAHRAAARAAVKAAQGKNTISAQGHEKKAAEHDKKAGRGISNGGRASTPKPRNRAGAQGNTWKSREAEDKARLAQRRVQYRSYAEDARNKDFQARQSKDYKDYYAAIEAHIKAADTAVSNTRADYHSDRSIWLEEQMFKYTGYVLGRRGPVKAKGRLNKNDNNSEEYDVEKGDFKRRGVQVKCKGCGEMFDRNNGSCDSCGEKNEKMGVLYKQDDDFTDIEKDGDNATDTIDLDVELTDEDMALIEDLLDDIDIDGLDDDGEFYDADDEDSDDDDDDTDADDIDDESDTLIEDDADNADESDTLSDSTTDHSEEGDMGKTPETGIDKSTLDANALAYVESLEKRLEALEPAQDDIFKTLDPKVAEVVRKAQQDAEEAQSRIAKMEEDQERSSYRNIAKGYTGLSAGDDLGDALFVLAKADEKAYEEVTRVLRGANEAVVSSTLLKSVGSGRTGDSDLDSRVAKRAEEIAKDQGITVEKARAQAWSEFSADYDRMKG